MNDPRTQACSAAEGEPLIRLDLLTNRYGPSPAVLDAISQGGLLDLPEAALRERLLRRLSAHVGLPPDWLLLANRADDLVAAFLLSRRSGPYLVRFSPGESSVAGTASRLGIDVVALRRGRRFDLGLDPELLEALPTGTVSIVGSPSDPTGVALTSQDAVRLARTFDATLIDERHGGYAGRSLIPYVREFRTLLVLQSFENWAGLDAFPLAYLAGPPSALQVVARFLNAGPASGGLAAAIATLEDRVHAPMMVRRTREDRSRLYRMLRKLSIVQPYPSMGNYLLATVELCSAETVVEELRTRGIAVHRPDDPVLGQALRITAGTAAETEALKRALIEVTRVVV